MKLDNCLIGAEEALGRSLTSKEKKQIVDKIDRSIKKFAGKDSSRSSASLMAAVLQDISDVELKNAERKKYNDLINASKKIDMLNRIKSEYGDAPAQGIMVQIKNSSVDRFGSKGSVIGAIEAKRANHGQAFISEVHAAGVYDILSKEKMDLDVNKAIFELNKDNPDQSILSKLPKEAITSAEIINKHLGILRSEINELGGDLGKELGYFGKQTHDQHKIGKAGGAPFGDPKNKEAWIKDLTDFGLDFKRSFADLTAEEVDKTLNSLYNQFSNGYHLVFGDDAEFATYSDGLSDAAKKVSKARVLHFSDAEGATKYNQKYGTTTGLLNNISSTINSLARDAAIMDRFGPSGIMNVDKVVKELAAEYNDIDGAKAAEILKAGEDIKKVYWPEISGRNGLAQNSKLANFFAGLRATFSFSMLGGSALGSLPDASMVGSTVRYFTTRDTKAFANGFSESFKLVFGKLNEDESRKLATKLGIIHDHIIPNFQKEIGEGGDKLALAAHWYFKLNGQTRWTEKTKLAAASLVNNAHAEEFGKSFDQLHKGSQAAMRQFGIDAQDWDLIRSSKLFTDEQGRAFVDVTEFQNIDPANIENHPMYKEKIDAINATEGVSESTKSKQIELAKKQVVSKVENSYRNMMNEVAAIAASEPGAAERAFMFQGTQRGTILGEVVRSFWQFKSFTVSTMAKNLNRERYGYSRDFKKTFGQEMAELFYDDGSGKRGGVASMLAAGAVMGIAANYMKDLSKGLKPTIPEDPKQFAKVLTAGLARSGGMGIYGDFVFGDVLQNRHGSDPLTAFAGPTASMVSEAMKIAGSIKESAATGENTMSSAQMIKFAKSYTPGISTLNNHVLTSYLSNRFFFHYLMETANPGYLRKYEANLKKNAEKEYFDALSPAKNIPSGGLR